MHPVFERLQTIEHDNPELTADDWFDAQPSATIRFASKTVIISQPSSTALVYLLGVLTILAGLYFLQLRGAEISRMLWGVSLLLWGIGAILAGTSHQAFGYQLRSGGLLRNPVAQLAHMPVRLTEAGDERLPPASPRGGRLTDPTVLRRVCDPAGTDLLLLRAQRIPPGLRAWLTGPPHRARLLGCGGWWRIAFPGRGEVS